VVARHGENEIGSFDELTGKELSPVPAQVEAVLESHEVGSLGCGGSIPCPGTGGGDGHLFRAPAGKSLPKQRLGHGTAAGVTGADEEDAHAQKIIRG
jgi:hypothetical protein